MKLPDENRAFIPKTKLIDYVLSETHATGKFKAKFFRNLGFDETNIKLFEKNIRKMIKLSEVKSTNTSIYGVKHVIEGKINTPVRNNVIVRTIWIIENKKVPRFITIYPV